jgi:hypothetical protein
MRHIKVFENFQDIESTCKKYRIKNWTINPDGTVDVDGDVNLRSMKLNKLPLNFRRVNGDFNCSCNKLIDLKGAPSEVGGHFNCAFNKLISLEGGPEKVGGYFGCNGNKLTTLEGGPKEVVGEFWCIGNPIFRLYRLFPDRKSFMNSMDYGYLRGGTIVKFRFKEALDEFGLDFPESISGYKYI